MARKKSVTALILFFLAAVVGSGRVEVPSGYVLGDGQEVRVRVTPTGNSPLETWVMFAMCGALSCKNIWVAGMGAGGIGEYAVGECLTNSPSWLCTIIDRGDGLGVWRSTGTYQVFVLKRSVQSHLFMVWLDGRPLTKVTFRLAQDEQELKIRTFSGHITLLNIPGRVTDGHPLEVGEGVSLRLNVTDNGWLSIAMCGRVDCSSVKVLGVTAGSEGRMGYRAGIVRTNDPYSEFSSHLHARTRSDSARFIPGTVHWFRVQRRSRSEVDVWLEDARVPREVVTLPLGQGAPGAVPDRVELRARASAGSVALFTEVNCGVPRFGVKRNDVSEETRTSFGAHPWQAAVFLSDSNGDRLLCGGVLIHERWVATAAQCLSLTLSSTVEAVLNGSVRLFVRLGDWDLRSSGPSDKEKLPHEDYTVETRVVHPLYSYTSRQVPPLYDLALLKLKTPVSFKDHILPVCLPNGAAWKHVSKSMTGVVTGWGILQDGGASLKTTLKQSQVEIFVYDRCQILTNSSKSYIHFCAGTRQSAGEKCNGDPGGPLTLPVSGKTTLIGITSWSTSYGSWPGVYTNVTTSLPWLHEVVDGTST